MRSRAACSRNRGRMVASPQSLRIRSGSCRASRCWNAIAAGSPDSSSSNSRPSTSISSAVCDAVRGVHAAQASEAHAQDFKRRQLVVERPFGVAAFEREDAAFAIHFGFDARQRKNAALPAVQRREHQVAVVKPQRVIELARPARPGRIFVGMRDFDLQHWARALLPQIHALGDAAGERLRLPRGFIVQMPKHGVRPRDVKHRRETVNQ